MTDNYIRFHYTYHFSAGSVPPPDHYEYDLSMSDQGGMLEYWNDYRSPSVESKKFFFKLDQGKIAKLRILITNIGFRNWEKPDEILLGGYSEWLDGEDGFSIPSELRSADRFLVSEVFTQMKELVPKGIWREINHEISDDSRSR
jgi:hypothetical protein